MSKRARIMKNTTIKILKNDKIHLIISHFYSIFANDGDKGRGKLLRITIKRIYIM